MLLVLLASEGEWYGIDAKQIVEVVPYVQLLSVENSRDNIGMLMRHGKAIPIIDFTKIIASRPSKILLSTRIAIISAAFSDAKERIGILAEGLTETMKIVQPQQMPHVNSQDFVEQTIIVEGRSIKLINLFRLCGLRNQAPNADNFIPAQHD